jgi:predicted phage terminase large subunit-like protein
MRRRKEVERLEASFSEFCAAAWRVIDASTYESNWHIEAICQHLEAVADGRIRKLLINIAPRHSKTLIVSVLFQCWIWAQTPEADRPLCGPQVKFLCVSYGDAVVYDAAVQARRLIESDWYQERWGKRVKIASDQSAKNKFDTTAGGSRISSPMGGAVLGRGGDIRIIDDPIKADEGESEAIREGVIASYEATLRSRVTDPRTTATILIMQRLHERDLAGHILATEKDWVHLCLPEEYDPRRHCSTMLGWNDPRTEQGELLWPERFSLDYLEPFKRNPFIWSGQYQQAPAPPGGGIFKTDWWQLWPPEGETFDERGNPIDPATGERKWLEFPPMDYVVVSVDTALTTKEENDWSACTVWGVFTNERNLIKVVLLWAWQDRLAFHELVEKIILTCRGKEKRTRRDGTEYEAILGFKADSLLIEAKANGWSVIQEIARLCKGEEFGVYPWDPKKHGGGDIIARAHAVSHLFAAKIVYAPDRDWATNLIDEMAMLPKAAHDDLSSSAIQALKFLRDQGLLSTRDERQAQLDRLADYKAARPVMRPYDV